MYILETHATSDKQALKLSCEYLETDSSDIDVKIFKKGISGFLGFGTKKPNLYHVFYVENKTPVNVVVKGVAITILNKMGFRANISDISKNEEGKIIVTLKAPSIASYIIGKEGKTLESLQIIINVITERILKKPLKIILDIENYRERRKKRLESMGLSAAEKVVDIRQSRLLRPLNPYERRVIYIALQGNDKITTESIGSGTYKRICIRPSESLLNSAPSDEGPEEEASKNIQDQELKETTANTEIKNSETTKEKIEEDQDSTS